MSFAKFDYVYDSADNRTSRTETMGELSFGSPADVYNYDPTDQLTEVKYNFDAGMNTEERNVSYAYDTAGNRTSMTDTGAITSYKANSLNQYTTVDGDTPTYDSNGNLRTQRGWTYTYDAQNRLTAAQSAQDTVSFSYDPRNRCVSRTVNGIVTFFYWTGWTLIEEQNARGALMARYVNGANVDEIIARVTPSLTAYYHHDALGSVVALTSARGKTMERYSYDAFGATIFKDSNGDTVSGSASGNRSLFTGREYIQQLAFYDYRNRAYSPGLGRFLQTDPIRFSAKDVNIYRYVRNNPASSTDPTGLGTCVDGEYHSDGGPAPSGIYSNYQECFNMANFTRNWEVNENCYECDSFDRIVPIAGCAEDREADMMGMLEVCKTEFCRRP
jgi:RHS repeat-associated protein